MKKHLILMLLLPLSLSAIADEHGGKAAKKKVPGLQTSEQATTEHGGQAAKQKEHATAEAEHGGQAAKKKVQGLLDGEQAATTSEHGGTAVTNKAAEHGGTEVKKKAAEHAGQAVQ